MPGQPCDPLAGRAHRHALCSPRPEPVSWQRRTSRALLPPRPQGPRDTPGRHPGSSEVPRCWGTHQVFRPPQPVSGQCPHLWGPPAGLTTQDTPVGWEGPPQAHLQAHLLWSAASPALGCPEGGHWRAGAHPALGGGPGRQEQGRAGAPGGPRVGPARLCFSPGHFLGWPAVLRLYTGQQG